VGVRSWQVAQEWIWYRRPLLPLGDSATSLVVALSLGRHRCRFGMLMRCPLLDPTLSTLGLPARGVLPGLQHEADTGEKSSEVVILYCVRVKWRERRY